MPQLSLCQNYNGSELGSKAKKFQVFGLGIFYPIHRIGMQSPSGVCNQRSYMSSPQGAFLRIDYIRLDKQEFNNTTALQKD